LLPGKQDENPNKPVGLERGGGGRPGERGRGRFRRGGGGVRNLALRAAQAAKSTQELIEQTLTRVREGASLVGQTNEAFANVETASRKVGELVGEIAVASVERSTGIDQVNNSIAQMDQVTQSNAGATEQLSSQAEEMSGVVAVLINIVQGGGKGQGAVQGKKSVKALPAAPETVTPRAARDGRGRGDDEGDFKDF